MTFDGEGVREGWERGPAERTRLAGRASLPSWVQGTTMRGRGREPRPLFPSLFPAVSDPFYQYFQTNHDHHSVTLPPITTPAPHSRHLSDNYRSEACGTSRENSGSAPRGKRTIHSEPGRTPTRMRSREVTEQALLVGPATPRPRPLRSTSELHHGLETRTELIKLPLLQKVCCSKALH